MNRTRLALLAGGLLLATVVAACGSATDRGGGSSTPAAPSPAATASAVSPSPTPEVRIWGAGGAVSILFGSFAEWARQAARGTGGVALVRITDVSVVRWSTATGERPSEADIARAAQTGASIYVGRLVTVELVRMLRGSWPVVGDTALYWLSGGQIGNDLTPSYAVNAGLPELRAGFLAVVETLPGADIDEATDGILRINVNVLFPIDDVGRVQTFWPNETITVNDLERYLPVP